MNAKKLLSLFLAFALSLSVMFVFTACDDEGKDDSTKKGTDDSKAWYANLDFGGQTLNISQSINTWTTDSSIDNAAKYTRGPSQAGTTDKVLNLCYDRNKEVAQLLNVKIKYTETNYRYNEINPYLDQLAMQSQAQFDLIINDVIAVVPAILKGQLYNLKSTEETNYLDLSHSSWYQDYMNGLTLDENKIYAVAGDYFIDVLRSAHCLYLNTELFQTNLNQNYASLDEFFDMVAAGQWTYDEFNTLINDGWVSSSGNATASIDDDCIGFLATTGAGFNPFTMSTDIQLIQKDASGNYSVNHDISQLSTYAEKLNRIYTNDGTVVENNQSVNFRDIFTQGRALFLNTYWLGDLEFSSFQAMENKAPIIYPKWHEEQTNYRAYVHDSAEIGYILTNTANFTPMSAYLQLINEKSVPILSEYYEYTLKFKKNTQPGAVKMIEIIHDSIASPFDQFIGNQVSATLNNKAVQCNVGGIVRGSGTTYVNTSVSSTFNSCVNKFETGLATLVANFKSQR